MKHFLKFVTAIIFFLQFFGMNSVSAISSSATTSVNLQVQTGISPLCNQNGICDPQLGENESNCFTDCGCNNNGICQLERGENYQNCLSDCPAPGAVIIYDTAPVEIFNLLIEKITINSIEISWQTDDQAVCQLFLGKTQDYEKESVSETAFYRRHSTTLINLSPGTTYHFKIKCRDTNQNESETADQKFTTLSLPDIIPPANIFNFEAIAGDKQITLNWQNPPDSDFKAVKIMRSEKFYPSNPWEGMPVYNERGESFTDTELKNGKRYYYTVFAYDKAGNYASGAIASAVPQKPIPPEIPLEIPPEIPPEVPPELVPPEIEKLTLEDFDLSQKGANLLPIEEKKIEVKPEEPLTTSIDYEKVPEVLKTIMVTLEKEGKTFSFLLRINKEKTAYQATIITPKEPGIYSLTFTILDYKNQTLKKIVGQLEVTETRSLPVEIPWYKQIKILSYILLTIVILGGIIICLLRKKRAST